MGGDLGPATGKNSVVLQEVVEAACALMGVERSMNILLLLLLLLLLLRFLLE